jgi:hypothetical protein
MEKEIRIPRPRGCTVLARTGQYSELESRIIEGYLNGSFPYGHQGLDMFSFSQLFGVPLMRLKKAVKDGIAENLIEDLDSRLEIQKERSKAFSSALFRIGSADRDLGLLLRHIASRTLNNPASDPLLLKEFNSALGNSIRLTETQLKAIMLLSDVLKSLPEEVLDISQQLTRDEVLHLLSQPQPQLEAPEDAPDLSPHSSDLARTPISYNRDASHEALKGAEIPLLSKVTKTTVIPR